eukprot:TRINITY_DN8146_c0_g1_i1.p1 TRINITY_DN8146_c0_g1~~TRINITY_DN8146_c0_g1_i1.p1  ORF type:complete len:430 (-),score=41.80 TRINITY_DN8146_c0_g1_i1:203-1492(-)
MDAETAISESLGGLRRLDITCKDRARKESCSDEETQRQSVRLTLSRSGSYSPVRHKAIKTRPRGFDEETIHSGNSRLHQMDVQMDSSIWQHLPEDLIILILSRVCPFYLFRLRSVCKRWNSILQDSSFLEYHSQSPTNGPCLLTFTRNSQSPQGSVFRLPSRTWHKLPLGFLPDWTSSLVGTSGGLVCFSGWDGHIFKILVCNPLTQQWRTLPPMRYSQQRQLLMVADRQNKTFKVVAANDISGTRSLPTEIYDSKQNSWSIHQSLPAVNLGSSKMVFCNSKIYLETLSPLGLIVFRMDVGQWEQIHFKFPRSLLEGYLVPGARSRLFLVGRIRLYTTNQRVRIWEMDHVKSTWVEIGKMPKRIFTSLRLFGEQFECTGQDNLICFISGGKGLIYDADRKTWSLISGCARHSLRSQMTFYEPRLDSSIG